jgi:hypothetical protein
MTEQEIIKELNKISEVKGFVLAKNQYSHYDAENKENIVEIKSRRAKYDPHLIEYYKAVKNQEIAIEKGKDFLYLVEHNQYLYIWNISQMVQEEYDFKFEKRVMPKTTDFDDNSKKEKVVGYLYEKDAIKIDLIL